MIKTKIQSQIINILGAIAVLALIEVLIIQLLVREYDFTILTTLILIPSNVVAALGGFIHGKATAALEEKTDPQQYNNVGDVEVGEPQESGSACEKC